MSALPDNDPPRSGGRARRILIWLVLALVALVLLLFAISNKELTELQFWPFPVDIKAPLYLVSLILLIGGFVLGHFFGWLGQARWRRDARRDAKRVAALEQELEALRTPDVLAVAETGPGAAGVPVAMGLIAARPAR